MECESKGCRFNSFTAVFTAESLLKSISDYIRLFHSVNYMCEALLTIMTPDVLVRNELKLNKQKSQGPKKFYKAFVKKILSLMSIFDELNHIKMLFS